MTNQDYEKEQLNRLNIDSETISIKLYDYNGNETKTLEFNDIASIKTLINFLNRRKKVIEKRNTVI